MNPSRWLLAALLLAGCSNSQVDIALTPPEFFENASPTASPADLRYPADTFRLAETRFIHGRVVATHPSIGAEFSLTPECVLLDSAITTLATVTDTIPFVKGSLRTEWTVTFGQATPGQWKAGWYRVACEMGGGGTQAPFTGTNATFQVVP
jgi:hypothetical protein